MLRVRTVLLCSALAIGLFVHAASHTPTKQPLPEAQPGDQQASSTQRGTEQLPFVIDIKSVPEPTEKEKADNAAERHEKAESDSWLVKLTGAIAVATVALVVATGFLWWSTRQLVKDTQNSAERQLRAYVFIEAMELQDFSVGTRPKLVFRLKNYGQTPAHNVRVQFCSVISATWEDFAFKTELPGLIPPGDHMLGTNIFPVLTELVFSDVVLGRCLVWFNAQIDYVDAFGRHQCTRARRFYKCDGNVPEGTLAFTTDQRGESAT